METVELARSDVGDGPVVVLLHGHPFNRSMWSPQLAALREDYRVVAPDLRGYGDSPVTKGTVTMRQLAADVERLLDRAGIERAAVAGLSMGGLVAMELAIASPARWWALALVATTAQPLTSAERDDRLAKADLAEREGMQPLAQDMAAHLFGSNASAAVAEQIMAMMLATNPFGAAAALRGRAQRPDYRPLLKQLDVASFVCTGDEDTFSTAEVTRELTESLRRPQKVTLPGVGHMPNLEAAARFNSELRRFLASARPG